MCKPYLYYTIFVPTDDITRNEVRQIFNSVLFTIAEHDGFSINVDDDVSTDDILHLLKRLICFAWPYDAVMPLLQKTIDELGDTARHFVITSKVFIDKSSGDWITVKEKIHSV